MPQDKVRVSSRNSGSKLECRWQRNDNPPGTTADWKDVYTRTIFLTGINKGHFNRIKVIRGAKVFQNNELTLNDDFEIIFIKD